MTSRTPFLFTGEKRLPGRTPDFVRPCLCPHVPAVVSSPVLRPRRQHSSRESRARAAASYWARAETPVVHAPSSTNVHGTKRSQRSAAHSPEILVHLDTTSLAPETPPPCQDAVGARAEPPGASWTSPIPEWANQGHREGLRNHSCGIEWCRGLPVLQLATHSLGLSAHVHNAGSRHAACLKNVCVCECMI